MGSKYVHLTMRADGKSPKWLCAKLAVRLYWMDAQGWDYEQLKKFGSHRDTWTSHGVKSNIE